MLCSASSELEDPVASARCLDVVLEPHGGARWAEMLEVEGERLVRSVMTIDGTTLVAFANSERRFEHLKAIVVAAVDGLAPIMEARESLAEASRRLGKAAAPSDLLVPPSPAAAALAELMRAREVRWLDEPIPALGDLTPRQAAADPTRREDLVAILHEYERTPIPRGAGRLRRGPAPGAARNGRGLNEAQRQPAQGQHRDPRSWRAG